MVPLQSFHPSVLDVGIRGEIQFRDKQVRIYFELADPAGVVIDSLVAGEYRAGEMTRADELWKTTCFEAFWGRQGQTDYWELNLSPRSKRWNLYHFTGYRQPQPPVPSSDFTIESLKATRTTLECALVSRTPLDKMEASLCAIAKVEDGTLYFSSHHAGEKPDFHNRAGFLIK